MKGLNLVGDLPVLGRRSRLPLELAVADQRLTEELECLDTFAEDHDAGLALVLFQDLLNSIAQRGVLGESRFVDRPCEVLEFGQRLGVRLSGSQLVTIHVLQLHVLVIEPVL